MTDDRIKPTDCANLAPDGRCRAAMRRERKDVSRHYGPSEIDLPRRCEWFKAKAGAADQRSGKERFPELMNEYIEKYGEAA